MVVMVVHVVDVGEWCGVTVVMRGWLQRAVVVLSKGEW